MSLSPWLKISDDVREALAARIPVVALETAVVTHGLPAPYNVDIFQSMEAEIRTQGAMPATCLIDEGCLWIGADVERVTRAAQKPDREKASVRDLGMALSAGKTAGLTVSATLFASHLSGIRVFATGGIGGVHLGAEVTGDVSADLQQLSRSPVITVCSGAKSVLDIPRTLEYLETLGVPVFTLGSPYFPAFYLETSGMTVAALHSVEAVARAVTAQWDLGYGAGAVVGVPVPKEDAILPDEWTSWIERARDSAAEEDIRGKDVTPFLLSRVAEYSDGRTVRANTALLRNNARVAGRIAAALTR